MAEDSPAPVDLEKELSCSVSSYPQRPPTWGTYLTCLTISRD